jgi:hypothetical protein
MGATGTNLIVVPAKALLSNCAQIQPRRPRESGGPGKATELPDSRLRVACAGMTKMNVRGLRALTQSLQQRSPERSGTGRSGMSLGKCSICPIPAVRNPRRDRPSLAASGSPQTWRTRQYATSARAGTTSVPSAPPTQVGCLGPSALRGLR